jgi:putative oxidoreductase
VRRQIPYWDMQRLFSTFPNSWPGLGLLILRLTVGFSLVVSAHAIGGDASTSHLLERWLVYADVTLLWIGLWTPLAAIAESAMQITIMDLAQQLDPLVLLAAALGLALAMLGPGAWSLDARLFGRKRIV